MRHAGTLRREEAVNRTEFISLKLAAAWERRPIVRKTRANGVKPVVGSRRQVKTTSPAVRCLRGLQYPAPALDARVRSTATYLAAVLTKYRRAQRNQIDMAGSVQDSSPENLCGKRCAKPEIELAMRCSGPALVNRGAIDIRWMGLAEEYADSKAGHKKVCRFPQSCRRSAMQGSLRPTKAEIKLC